MKKYLLSTGTIVLGLLLGAQTYTPLTYVGNSAVVTVKDNTLVYNGGGFKAVGTGQVNNYGNMMVVGSATDKFETAAATNYVLKFTSLTNYGQLYISGLTQTNISGAIGKEYRDVDGGSYQQIGMPFFNKTIYSLSGATELAKSLSNNRYSLNEVLKYDAPNVVAANTDIYTATTVPSAYYMIGTKGIDFSKPYNDATKVFTFAGRPVAEGIGVTLTGANSNVPNFGTNGFGKNIYNEYYNSYLQDPFITTAWTGQYGKNFYQYSNPYLTNIDLSGVYKVETASDPTNDGNYISNIQGIRFSPGKYIRSNAGTFSTTGQYLTFSTGNPRVAVGDFDNLIIRPLQTFVIKLADGNAATSPATLNLNFDKLRRFKDTARDPAKAYSVTASRNGNANSTVKQLGVIAYDANGLEMGRTYFVVYDNGVSGHNTEVNTQVQNNSDNVIGTFEENAVDGGIDPNYQNQYWLYINEVNEQNFKGKAVPMSLYNPEIKTLKFQVRENESLLEDGVSNLSTGIGFYYKSANGALEEIAQNASIPVSSDSYALYYGKPDSTLGTDATVKKANRTQITYNPAIDNYIVRFDPDWKDAQVQVYDASGKLVFSKKNVSTGQDFVLQLNKENRVYVVTAISSKGEKAVAKIIR